MKHLSEEEITLAYYNELDPAVRAHLDECDQCRAAFEELRRVLDGVRDIPVPERGESYGGEVWTRLLPHLPVEKPRRRWLQWWTVAPAMLAVAVAAFVAGILIEQRHETARGISARARERVLLIAMGDHLDRSQMVLAEVVNAAPGAVDLGDERGRARDLVVENRLLRQTATRRGDLSDAAVLDELERTLLDIANGPANPSASDIEALQQRIEKEGLLLKVRIIGSNVRQEGQQL
ncbi:MAG TPA: hypothetical protein VMJ34_19415 [Bryobacteraceae bacterium]|nr:hypothetical protein [Bryobacteraceae bacterium]